MTDINKQKFLAELGKLLTFMYEEDRLDALDLYDELFDSCADEQQLLQHLISPTRQAVVLARAYNAKERMLSVQSQSRRDDVYDDEFEAVPAFILAIENVRREAPQLFTGRPAEEPVVDDAQFSLFSGEAFEEAELVDEPAAEELPAQTGDEVVVLESEALSTETAEADDDFFTEAEILEDVTPVYDDGEELRFSRNRSADDIGDDRLRDLASRHRPHKENVQYKRSVALLILYIIFAVPITLLLVAVLLIPTVLSLVLSLGFVAGGVSALGCAFGSFAIFADILVVLGVALILLALGLLFFWLFVWFIGGAIAGFVNGVIKLGDKFSSREVSA